jgi:hypothetical protein
VKARALAALAAFILLAGSGLALNGCEFSGGTTGGSETTNGLTGIIRDEEGRPAVRAAVVLVPESYTPVPGMDARPLQRTVTDARGAYRFGALASGTYNLEAKDSLRHVQVLLRGIRINPMDSAPSSGTAGSPGGNAPKADGILLPSGSLEVPFADRHLPENAQVYLPGTTFRAFAASRTADGMLVLDNLAPGDYAALMAVSPDLGEGDPVAVTGPFRIGPDSATRLGPLRAWLHSARLEWDGAAAAALRAAAADTLPGSADSGGYPVLVRLTQDNFDFTQARDGGRDIRFSRGDGTPLPHQIEAWDAAAKTASVWVRLDPPSGAGVRAAVDSAGGGYPDSALVLHWGRSDAVDVSNGDKVFDRAQGFAAVWHLSESANAVSEGYRDATSGADHAAASALDAGSRVDAAAGPGRTFFPGGGTLSAALPQGLGGNGSFTVTFWMRFQTTPGRAGVLTFGQPSLNRGFHFLIRADTTAQFGPWDVSPDSNDAPSAQQNHFDLAPYLGKWAHVATVHDALQGRLTTYIDGVKAAENALPALDIALGTALEMGKAINMVHLPQSPYSGSLDEVRVYDRAVPESWIRLDHATQKEGAAVRVLP